MTETALRRIIRPQLDVDEDAEDIRKLTSVALPSENGLISKGSYDYKGKN